MTEEELIQGLAGFGLTEGEAKSYLFLVKAGSSPARAIARKLKVSRMKIYRILRALQGKGFVEISLGRPVKFIATPVEGALNRRIEGMKVEVSGLEKRKGEIINYCKQLCGGVEVFEEPRFRFVQGRQQVYDLLLQMFERAKFEICIITTENDLYRFSLAGIDDLLRDLTSKGVKTLLLTYVNASGFKAIESYMHFVQVRHITLPTSIRIAIVDGNEVVTTFAMDDSMSMTIQEDTGLWTNAQNYVKTMDASFKALWASGVSGHEILKQLKTQQIVAEGLLLAKAALESKGWIVEIPGKLLGESKVEHTFDLVAKHENRLNRPIVVDLLTGANVLNQIFTLNVKAVDVSPAVHLLVATRSLEKEEIELANVHSAKLVYVVDAQQLAREINDEVVRYLSIHKKRSDIK